MRIIVEGIGGVGGVLAARIIKALVRLIKEIETGKRKIDGRNLDDLLTV
jgi:hypothetical protein